MSKRFQPFGHWTTEFLHPQPGCFSDLVTLFQFDQWPCWPHVRQLNALLHPEIRNRQGKPVQFVIQDEQFDFAGEYYEQVIFNRGLIPTRSENWHDIFGGFIWCLFPKTKALLNQLHIKDIEAHGLQARTARRDAITFLDECGVLMASSEPMLEQHLKQHAWQKIFVEQRSCWTGEQQTRRAFMFGHANYEMMTRPYVGLTGKVMVITVSQDFFNQSLQNQYAELDDKLVDLIEDGILNSNQAFSPLPLLGVPGWWSENEDFSFYDNTRYFRPAPTKRK